MREKIRTAARVVLALGMVTLGVDRRPRRECCTPADHFATPDFFARIVPHALPVQSPYPEVGASVPREALWARPPRRLVFIGWALWVLRPPARGDS